MSPWHTLSVLACVVITILVLDSQALSCLPCGEVLPTNPCPVLPDSCQHETRVCGCCEECAGVIGTSCNSSSVRCADGLFCVNFRGEALTVVPWFMQDYVGSCQHMGEDSPNNDKAHLT